jgi:hypothetical protein
MVEAQLAADLSNPEVKALQASVETIDREAKSVPMRHSALFFDLMMHVELVRARIAARLGS